MTTAIFVLLAFYAGGFAATFLLSLYYTGELEARGKLKGYGRFAKALGALVAATLWPVVAASLALPRRKPTGDVRVVK